MHTYCSRIQVFAQRVRSSHKVFENLVVPMKASCFVKLFRPKPRQPEALQRPSACPNYFVSHLPVLLFVLYNTCIVRVLKQCSPTAGSEIVMQDGEDGASLFLQPWLDSGGHHLEGVFGGRNPMNRVRCRVVLLPTRPPVRLSAAQEPRRHPSGITGCCTALRASRRLRVAMEPWSLGVR